MASKAAPPLCQHGEAAVRRQVRKEGPNKGRFFWACARGYGSGRECRFFAWDGAAAPATSADSARHFNNGFSGQRPLGGRPLASAINSKGRTLPPRPPSSVPSPPAAGRGASARPTVDRARVVLQLVLMRRQHLEVSASRSCPPAATTLLQTLANAIPTLRYEPASGKLHAPLSAWPSLERAVRERGGEWGGHVPLQLLEALHQWWQSSSSNMAVASATAVNWELYVERARGELVQCGLWRRLLPFQRESVERAIRQGGRILIGDEMGLGKSIQAIAIARCLRTEWPLLVVCPSSMRHSWCESFVTFLAPEVHRERDMLLMMKGAELQQPLRPINVVSYDLVTKLNASQLQRVGVLVCDESHYLKSPAAKRTQFLLPWMQRVPRLVLLTGTPALSRPEELFVQVHALAPRLFGNWEEFAYRYCQARPTPWKALDTSGASNLSELHMLLNETVMIRRLKREVLDQLPSKVRSVVYVDVDKSQEAALMASLQELQWVEARAHSGDANANNLFRAQMSKAYQATATAKRRAVVEYCEQLAAQGTKFLLFAHHEHLLDALETSLRAQGVACIRIDGKTGAAERPTLVQRFQSEPQCQAALLGITAAGAGITLTAASVVVFAEIYWNPGVLRQAEDRAHRIGQRDSVTVRYLLLPNSLDERMWRAVNAKLGVVSTSLDGSDARDARGMATAAVGVTAGDGSNGANRTLDEYFGQRRRESPAPSTGMREGEGGSPESAASEGDADRARLQLRKIGSLAEHPLPRSTFLTPPDTPATGLVSPNGGVWRASRLPAKRRRTGRHVRKGSEPTPNGRQEEADVHLV
ncbi:hypothetical protein CDCA_CDCA10G3047 [Cyanidium caldarium]|uniref:Uncharacterized protein n=1 Tax=Cyanidium caldarium TaxID=2771 RepID=A0AAV9IXL4_CYACA|nr:hypothetical protein CDCA_CDCA10G3047 [Cyanidium caldarium]